MLGDIVEIDCTLTKVGMSSITVLVNVTKESKTGQGGAICDARFVFVALKDGLPFPHNIELN
jgi:acyl-CoA hydrolase